MAELEATQHVPAAPASVLRSLNLLAHRLERVLVSLGADGGADTELRSIAGGILEAAQRSPDVALASIYRNQIAGPYAVRHCVEVAIICALVAPAIPTIAAALTMNAGMVRLVETFQLRDCALSDEERRAVLHHPAESAELLRRAGVDDEAWIACVLAHHELDDGSGYPEGRRAGDIPEAARLIGMADRYCAMVSARNYRRSLLPPDALRKLRADGNHQRLMAAFEQDIGEYPPGTLVRLANGETGVVSSRRGEDGAIQVHTLRDTLGVPFLPFEQRSTREPHFAIAGALHEDSAGLRFSMRQIWGDAAAV
ncbi:HD domain-containing protein [Massilia sp. RP-1-19]|uniref:HD domain-containing protein n=1 Tax=Massilia polaris TaxID=2728846 RepID=A0A848HG29_9BURK|nr:HD domain-containing phosphohydrolase [Massilia polaris]NML60836.1 HD domain-containing protein [Massilia polaris]